MKRRSFLIGLAASSFAEAAEQRPRLAILSPASRDAAVMKLVNEPFKKALEELGWVASRNIDIAERFADHDDSRLAALATELVALSPRVIFTNTNFAAAVAARATSTIPIVVGPAGEATLTELAGGSLARPAANVTGFVLTAPDIDSKALALLLEAKPAAKRVGVLINPRNPQQQSYPAPLIAAMGSTSVALIRLESGGLDDIDLALARAGAEGIDALLVADDSHIAANPRVRERLLRFAATRIPVASSHLDYARDGALLAMGPSIPALAAAAAGYVDKILKGARPYDLPIQLPTIFTTIVNLKTAKALGLTMPPSILLRADEVIE